MTLTQDIRVAVSAWPVEALPDWDALAGKLDHWLGQAAGAGADIAVIPEYAGMEAALAGGFKATSVDEWVLCCAEAAADYAALCGAMAERYGLYLLAGSMPEMTNYGLVNRARFHAPDGAQGYQDKQMLTQWERANTALVPGAPLTAFETDLGRIGALICYDSEFPALASALGTDLLLVPSSTEAASGRNRVQVGCRARALEGQCVVATSPLVGGVGACEIVDTNTGQAGIYGPPDLGFPEDGVIAAGEVDSPGWVLADISPAVIVETREKGAVSPLADRGGAEACGRKAEERPLCHNRP